MNIFMPLSIFKKQAANWKIGKQLIQQNYNMPQFEID
ncbi:unnamed protein product [Paramecium primaurelia]|uniref:Uncharacterized protein n=1 Tax=Paramecium primaurelia TaxID=5886 RepID=A0A8S1JQE9_PARPR|nr:unnamed protein product [Paramecium primaurelia]